MVLTAIVLLIAGFVLAKPFLVMWSIAVSVLSAVFLVIGALLRRHELFPGGNAGASPLSPPKGPVPTGPVPAPHGMPNRPQVPPHMMAPHGMQQQTATVPPQPRRSPATGPATAARRGVLDAEAIVLVIPGRKRYHVAGCRQLVGRDHEELTHEEAQEEGFTPCTTCLSEFTAATRSQEAPSGAEEPAGPPTTARESAPVGGAREPGPHEATARFAPPYAPVTPSAARQEAPEARQEPSQAPQSRPEAQTAKSDVPLTASEATAVRQEAAPSPEEAPASLTRSYVQPSASGQPPAAPAHPQEPVRPQEPARVQEPESPPLRAAKSPAAPVPSFPILPVVPEIPHAESSATNWFSRDAATGALSPEPASGPSAVASASAEAETGSADRPASPGPQAVADGSAAETGEPAAGAGAPAASGASGDEPATPEPDPSQTVRVKPVTSEPAGPAPATPEPAGPGAEEDESVVVEVVEDESPATGAASADRADDTPEPVEPAETTPGRAGRTVPADSTPAEPAPVSAAAATGAPPASDDRDDDTSPRGIPAIKDEPRPASAGKEAPSASGGGMVKIISGTRRFHDATCPIAKGADIGGAGVETMSRAEAEEAGMSGCPICLTDRQTVR
ncbi:hypothetical protein [Streptosporangium fragile]|uniref:hypothetical protein n=1 Tax=Streptosporangium fragile TaxID=46186 RepID=UPI0031ED5767